jgi:predicted dehydrogenase
LCARTERRAKPLAEKYDVRIFLDYDDALNEKGVDAVVISTPNHLHYPMAIKAIENGKHVMCEMPIAATLEQVRELKQAAEDADLLLMPVLNFRWAPIYVKAKEMIKAGDIGEPIAIHYREFLPAKDISEQWPIDSWAWDVEKSGGYPDFTLSVWSIDMLRWMFGQEYEE